jgi:hypothetical protein
MATAVARQKQQAGAPEAALHHAVRRVAEGRMNRPEMHLRQALQLVQPAAAQHAQHPLRHRPSTSSQGPRATGVTVGRAAA